MKNQNVFFISGDNKIDTPRPRFPLITILLNEFNRFFSFCSVFAVASLVIVIALYDQFSFAQFRQDVSYLTILFGYKQSLSVQHKHFDFGCPVQAH